MGYKFHLVYYERIKKKGRNKESERVREGGREAGRRGKKKRGRKGISDFKANFRE